MTNPFLKYKDIKCVVLCAGKGTRMLPYSQGKTKVMFEIDNKPLLRYVIDYWKKYTNDFIFVVGYKKEQIIKYIKKLPIHSIFVEQKKPLGIADAINHIKDFVSENFIVVLGDCFCDGNFNFPNNMKHGLGVYETNNLNDIKRNYSVEIKRKYIIKVVEKPTEIINNYCGMGVYFFKNTIFDYIKLTEPSKLRNEVEITDVIQNMINRGEKFKPIFFKGYYLNITYPEDINILKRNYNNKIIL